MAICYAIGIGGSGSKTLEALIHLCAAGLGPDHLKLGFVDPDDGNGNLQRALTTLEQYRKARAALRRDNGQIAMDSACAWQRTPIEPLIGNGHWSPVPSGVRTPRDLFRYASMNSDERTLFDGLLLNDDREQELSLHEGFRGRPNIGAAVLGAMASDKEPFWQALTQACSQAQHGQDVRLFLVGSVFGGTGAAGLPVIARLLRNHIEEVQVQDRVRLGGALLLPYFAFPPPTSRDTDNAALSRAFLAKSQESLRYYAMRQRTQDEQDFDDLYLMGWPDIVALDMRQIGGKPQHNPPLMPELYAALAATRFFAQGASADHRVLHIGYDSERQALGWGDLPGVQREEGSEIKSSLGQALRFAHVYSWVYSPLLQNISPHIAKQYWFRRLLDRAGRGDDLRSDSARDALSSLDTHCRQLLRWAFTLQHQTSKGHLKVMLAKNIGLVGDSLEEDGLLNWHSAVSRRELEQFPDLIADAGTATGLDQMFENLHNVPVSRQSQGLGCFVECLFTQCTLS